MGFIYLVTNKINNKQYVGKTARDIKTRWKEHVRDSFKPSRSYNSILHCAIRKYGENNFIVSELEKCEDKDLNDREKHWIKEYQTCNDGYNISRGGNGYLKYNDEVLAVLWESGCSAKEITESLNSCISTIVSRLKGIGVSKQEIRRRGIERVRNKSYRKIYQYDIDGNFIREFPSVVEAKKFVGRESTVTNQIYTRKLFAGYQWRRYKADKIAPVSPIADHKYKGGRPVHQYTLEGEYIQSFRTISEAAEYFGAKNINSIRNVCIGKTRMSYGYQWRFEKSEKIPKARRSGLTRRVIRISDSGEEKLYQSITEAAIENKTHTGSIVCSCQGKANYHIAGFHWKYADEKRVS